MSHNRNFKKDIDIANQPAKYMDHSSSSETNSSSACQNISSILLNSKVHSHFRNSLHYSQPDQSTLVLSPQLWLYLSSGLIPSCFPTKILYASLFSPTHATFPAYHIHFKVFATF